MKVTHHGKVALLQLNPPTSLVYLGHELMQAIADELLVLEKDKNVNVVILTGKGQSFATGANIKEIQETTFHNKLWDKSDMGWFKIISTFRMPLIAAINGIAFKGGLELAMMCDIVVASEDSKMGLPETKLGVMPSTGGTVRLRQSIGKSSASKIILSGAVIPAADALKYGLVSRIYPKDDLIRNTIGMGQKIAENPLTASVFAK